MSGATGKASRPYVLIDVDGVLNAMCCQFGGEVCGCHEGWVSKRAGGFPVLLNPAHGPALLALAEETGAELAWGSTWEKTANKHIGPLIGLPVLPAARMPSRWATHKAQGFIPWMGGRPFVWFDDEPEEAEAAGRLASQRHLVITVDEVTGLTGEHIETAREWLLSLNGGER